MHITYLYDGAYPSTGADAWQVLNTVTALSRRGAQVTLICEAPRDQTPLTVDELLAHYDVQGTFELIQLKRPRGIPRVFHKWWHGVAALKLESSSKSDVIYSRNLPAVITALRRGYQVVYDTYRPWPQQLWFMRTLFKRLFRNPKLLGGFFHSSHARQAYLELGIDPQRLCVAHNGFHPELFQAAPTQKEARIALELPLDRLIIGYTGRLDREKGIESLLDLADALPEIILFLAGGSSDEAILTRARATKNIVLLSWQKPGRVPTLLSACDLLMIPASSVALQTGNTVLPMKIFEYLASGRPMIAPRSPDTADILCHDKNAWLIENDQQDELITQVKHLATDLSLREKLSQGALASAELLTWDARGDKLLKNIEQWLSG